MEDYYWEEPMDDNASSTLDSDAFSDSSDASLTSDLGESSGSREEESADDYRDTVPSLLKSSLDCVVRGLWLSEINNDWFETRELNVERVKNKLLQNRGFMSSLPSSIEKMLIENIDVVGKQLSDEFANLSGLGILASVFRERKWRHFAPLIWNFVKENEMNYHIAENIFKNIITDINDGVSCSGDKEFYLRIWRTFPEYVQSRLIVYLSNYHTQKIYKLKNLPRDLRFFAELVMNFDAEERKKIWQQNYPQLIVGASPSNLEHLMRSCFDNEEEIIEFKRQYFVECGNADQYCLDLIAETFFVELDQFLNFCSPDELDAEKFTKRVLHKYLASHSLAKGYEVVFHILHSKAKYIICRVIKMDEFQYLFRMQTEHLKEFCYKFMNRSAFKQLIKFLNFFLPPEKNVECFMQEIIKSLFAERVDPYKYIEMLLPYYTDDFTPLNKFSKVLDSLFSTSEAVARFKKEVIFCEGAFHLTRHILFSNRRVLRYRSVQDRTVCVKKFVSVFLPVEQDLREWKDEFVIDFIKYMRWSNEDPDILMFCDFSSEWKETLAWFLDSEERLSQLKTSLSMDEILCICIKVHCDAWGFDRILRWYFSNNEERIVFFKLQKLRESNKRVGFSHSMRQLCGVGDEFYQCTNDFDRCEVIRRTLVREEY
ncbi:uncharacterized protein LOC135831415 isoform X3 [Planococcus citri]|uniref:uncharacterized protein LOC135831415 isoform X3 n=1 Tax=Planococcus citri TaxID=170843 RepID=UPI0031FA13E3